MIYNDFRTAKGGAACLTTPLSCSKITVNHYLVGLVALF